MTKVDQKFMGWTQHSLILDFSVLNSTITKIIQYVNSQHVRSHSSQSLQLATWGYETPSPNLQG